MVNYKDGGKVTFTNTYYAIRKVLFVFFWHTMEYVAKVILVKGRMCYAQENKIKGYMNLLKK